MDHLEVYQQFLISLLSILKIIYTLFCWYIFHFDHLYWTVEILAFFFSDDALIYPVSIWIVADYDKSDGRQLLSTALKHLVSSSQFLYLHHINNFPQSVLEKKYKWEITCQKMIAAKAVSFPQNKVLQNKRNLWKV